METRPKIVSYNSYGELTVISESGKRYTYYNVSPYMARRLKTWNQLKRFAIASKDMMGE